MNYKIQIAPDKIQEFLQIIQSLQNLGVVTDLDALTNTDTLKKTPPLSIQRGSGKKVITYISDDFNASLDEFKGYM